VKNKNDKVEKELLKRYFENHLSTDEKQLIEKWLSDSENEEEVLDFIVSGYGVEKARMPVVPFNDMFAKAGLRDKPPVKSISLTKNKWIWGAAAACTLFLLGTWMGYSFNNDSAGGDGIVWFANTGETVNGQYAQVKLSDGSDVYLAGNSRISFSKMDIHPVVYLEGEAYFDLRNEGEVVTIKTKELVTKAKDSKFKIAAYSKDSLVTITVEKGKAEVQKNTEVFPLLNLRFPKADSENTVKDIKGPKTIPLVKLLPALIVRENQKVIYDKNNNQTNISQATPNSFPLIDLLPAKSVRDRQKAMENGRLKELNFYKADLNDIVRKLQETYNLQIEVNTAGNAKLPLFTGEFDSNVTVNEVLNRICDTLGMVYNINGQKVKMDFK